MEQSVEERAAAAASISAHASDEVTEQCLAKLKTMASLQRNMCVSSLPLCNSSCHARPGALISLHSRTQQSSPGQRPDRHARAAAEAQCGG